MTCRVITVKAGLQLEPDHSVLYDIQITLNFLVLFHSCFAFITFHLIFPPPPPSPPRSSLFSLFLFVLSFPFSIRIFCSLLLPALFYVFPSPLSSHFIFLQLILSSFRLLSFSSFFLPSCPIPLRYKPEARGLNRQSFRPHHSPGVDPASNINEYQRSSLEVKGGQSVGLTTLSPSCADCLKILGASTSYSSRGPTRPK
jgi:hypothetical protein